MFKRLIYKDVKPIYEIDENGNVYSEYTGECMRPSTDRDGYLRLTLSGEDGLIYVRVATLVAYNFIGNPPTNILDPTVDHIDDNPLNNNVNNLRWMERGINSSRRTNRGIGETNNQAKLSEEDVEEICKLLMENKLSLNEIGEMFRCP